MTKSNITIVDYTRAQEINFEGLLELTVINTGFWPLDVNGFLLKSGESKAFIKPDGTICDFKLNAQFTDGKNVFYEPKGCISPFDLLSNAAIFKELYYSVGEREYFIQSVQKNHIFEILRRDTFEPLDETFCFFQRQDKKNFYLQRDPEKDSPGFFNISEYVQYSNLVTEPAPNINRIYQPLYNYNQFFDPAFGSKNYRVISKRII